MTKRKVKNGCRACGALIDYDKALRKYRAAGEPECFKIKCGKCGAILSVLARKEIEFSMCDAVRSGSGHAG